MAGIYIHIPFCKHKCNYCNFYSLASTRYMDQIGNAIAGELIQRKGYLEGQTIETIYFGGGTPSLIETDDIEKILRAIYKHFRIEPDAEITLEANPDDLTPVKFTTLKNAGINRLSIGIQSFRQEDLAFLSRTHTSAQVTQCITDAQQAGFQNLSIDLIYGIPTLTDEGWKENLQKAFSFGIPHISAYSLTVEDKTPLEHMIRKGKMRPVNENLSLSQFHILCAMMQEQGYEQYEVSNFCLPGAYSRHNTAYWQGKSYLGAGPSAHSYNGISRCWNVANLATYTETVTAGEVKSEQELLSPTTQLNEYIMTSLRTMWGCDLVQVKRKFGEEIAENLLLDALTFMESEQMIYRDGKLVLTHDGLLFADGISAALFTEE
ncbi:MAG: radical SAM family heme chaperone HemW [Bacteroidales bacterium]|nr:radical SAM family heme chaperone HemW [Bacteroidales bacterium]